MWTDENRGRYTGLKKAVAAANVEIVKRPDQARGGVVLPKRRVVERTFAWARTMPSVGERLGMP